MVCLPIGSRNELDQNGLESTWVGIEMRNKNQNKQFTGDVRFGVRIKYIYFDMFAFS